MKVTLSTKQVIEICNCIAVLDQGYDQLIKDANGEKVVRLPYKIDGLTRMRLKITLDRLKPIVEAQDSARTALLKAKSPDTGMIDGKDDPKAFMEYQEEIRAMNDAETEVDVLKIEIEKLKLEENQIPVTALSALTPVLVESAPEN